MSLGHDDVHQFREYVANVFYRLSCIATGVIKQEWSMLDEGERQKFLTQADEGVQAFIEQQWVCRATNSAAPVGVEMQRMDFSFSLTHHQAAKGADTRLAVEIASKKDAIVGEAVSRKMPGSKAEELSAALRCETAYSTGAEIWYINDVAIVQIWPAHWWKKEDLEDFCFHMHVAIDYKFL